MSSNPASGILESIQAMSEGRLPEPRRTSWRWALATAVAYMIVIAVLTLAVYLSAKP